MPTHSDRLREEAVKRHECGYSDYTIACLECDRQLWLVTSTVKPDVICRVEYCPFCGYSMHTLEDDPNK